MECLMSEFIFKIYIQSIPDHELQGNLYIYNVFGASSIQFYMKDLYALGWEEAIFRV